MAKTPSTGIKVGTHFSPRFKRPLDDRLQFDSIGEMVNFTENALYDGIETYNNQTKKMYVWLSTNSIDPTLGKWRIFEKQDKLIAGNNIQLTPSDNGTIISATGEISLDYNDLSNKPVIPESTEDLINNSGFITNSTNNLENYYTKDDTDTKIGTAISSAYKAAGSKTVLELTSALLVADNLSKVYNMTTSGVTTADFVEGADKPIKVGDNVVIVDIGTSENPMYKYDLLGGFIDLSSYQTKTLSSSITVDGVSKTTVEDTLDAINTYSNTKINDDLLPVDQDKVNCISTTVIASEVGITDANNIVQPGITVVCDRTVLNLPKDNNCAIHTEQINSNTFQWGNDYIKQTALYTDRTYYRILYKYNDEWKVYIDWKTDYCESSKTVYVDQTNGSDDNDGTSSSRPFKSIEKAIKAYTTNDLTIRIIGAYANTDGNLDIDFDDISPQVKYLHIMGNTNKNTDSISGVLGLANLTRYGNVKTLTIEKLTINVDYNRSSNHHSAIAIDYYDEGISYIYISNVDINISNAKYNYSYAIRISAAAYVSMYNVHAEILSLKDPSDSNSNYGIKISECNNVNLSWCSMINFRYGFSVEYCPLFIDSKSINDSSVTGKVVDSILWFKDRVMQNPT